MRRRHRYIALLMLGLGAPSIVIAGTTPVGSGDFLSPLGLTAFVVVAIGVVARYAWKILTDYIQSLKDQIVAADARALRWETIATTSSSGVKELTDSVNQVIKGVAELTEIAKARSDEVLKEAVEKIVKNLTDKRGK